MLTLGRTGGKKLTPLLTIKGLTKAYPGVIANEDVSFEINPGEIHALLGENGAGKSTLVKMVYGLVAPDQGKMTRDGAPYRPSDPKAARRAGVAMVFQHFSLFEALSVAENVALGMEAPPPLRQLEARIKDVSHAYGLPLDPRATVGDLSAGERQRVEIIRCLLQNPKLLIMDEPTSVLTPQEVEVLFETLRKLKADGTSILYISHKLEEIRALCDAATILRQGKVVSRCTPAEKTAAELAELMVGSALAAPKALGGNMGELSLQVRDLSLPARTAFATPLREVSFAVFEGEIFGIGGVAGNGQDELVAALSGERLTAKDSISFEGEDISALGSNQRRAKGVFVAPEERLGHAAAPEMSLTENILLTATGRQDTTTGRFVDWTNTASFARDVIKAFDVRTPHEYVAARALSGGNLQKFVVGREILQTPSLLIINQPTWGVDAAAAAAIRQALLDLAKEGAAVVVISQDLEELLEISSRFAALNGGRLSEARLTRELSMEEIGLMLGGAAA